MLETSREVVHKLSLNALKTLRKSKPDATGKKVVAGIAIGLSALLGAGKATAGQPSPIYEPPAAIVSAHETPNAGESKTSPANEPVAAEGKGTSSIDESITSAEARSAPENEPSARQNTEEISSTNAEPEAPRARISTRSRMLPLKDQDPPPDESPASGQAKSAPEIEPSAKPETGRAGRIDAEPEALRPGALAETKNASKAESSLLQKANALKNRVGNLIRRVMPAGERPQVASGKKGTGKWSGRMGGVLAGGLMALDFINRTDTEGGKANLTRGRYRGCHEFWSWSISRYARKSYLFWACGRCCQCDKSRSTTWRCPSRCDRCNANSSRCHA